MMKDPTLNDEIRKKFDNDINKITDELLMKILTLENEISKELIIYWNRGTVIDSGILQDVNLEPPPPPEPVVCIERYNMHRDTL
jgi:hypothetical protein